MVVAGDTRVVDTPEMQFGEVVIRRRMVRNFADRALDSEVVDALLRVMLRVPSAGFTQGTDLLVLQGPQETSRYWNVQLLPERRIGFAWPGLLVAPLLVIPLANRQAYLDRYAESDKGWPDRDPERWPAPYWYVDAGFSVLLGLLAATDAGLGAAFFRVADPPAFREEFAVPEAFEPIGALAIGYPEPDRPSSSIQRGRRPMAEVVHRGDW